MNREEETGVLWNFKMQSDTDLSLDMDYQHSGNQCWDRQALCLSPTASEVRKFTKRRERYIHNVKKITLNRSLKQGTARHLVDDFLNFMFIFPCIIILCTVKPA